MLDWRTECFYNQHEPFKGRYLNKRKGNMWDQKDCSTLWKSLLLSSSSAVLNIKANKWLVDFRKANISFFR